MVCKLRIWLRCLPISPVHNQVSGRNEVHRQDDGHRQSADDDPRQRRILLAARAEL